MYFTLCQMFTTLFKAREICIIYIYWRLPFLFVCFSLILLGKTRRAGETLIVFFNLKLPYSLFVFTSFTYPVCVLWRQWELSVKNLVNNEHWINPICKQAVPRPKFLFFMLSVILRKLSISPLKLRRRTKPKTTRRPSEIISMQCSTSFM